MNMESTSISALTTAKTINHEQFGLSHKSCTNTDQGLSKTTKLGRLIRIKCAHVWNSYLSTILLKLYTYLAGFITYILLLCALYSCLMAIKPSIALFPKCRLMKEPIAKLSSNPDRVVQYANVWECQNGEALSVLIFYATGFIFGEIMEMLHLPGLLGKSPINNLISGFVY